MAFEAGDAGYRPPMWSVELFGEPRGEWMSNDRITDLVTGKTKRWDNADISNGEVMECERMIVKLVNQRKEPSEVGWQHLYELLRVGDSGTRKRTGKIALDTLRAILEKTFMNARFKVREGMAIALFMKYGHDEHGLMPYEMFAHRIFTSQAHQLSLEGCKKRAFDAKLKIVKGKCPDDWKWQGMIKYPTCKSGLFAPSDWEDNAMKIVKRSACLGLKDGKPEAYLKLEHVFGYSSPKNVSPNLFYNKEADAVYYTASVGIVYDDDLNRQKFFLRHDDDIMCLAMNPKDRDTVATGQVGAEPTVWVWSSSGVKNAKMDPYMTAGPVQTSPAVCSARS